jgi:hypothetical protein
MGGSLAATLQTFAQRIHGESDILGLESHPVRFTGDKMRKPFALLFLLSALVFGQDLKSIIPQHKPGDSLSYRVEFNGDPGFTAVVLFFDTPAHAPNDQPSLASEFSLNHFVRVKAGVYDVDGKIPNSVITGDYQLVIVKASIDPASKPYDAKSQNILIHIDNDTKYDFSPLKSVKPN